MNIFHYKIDPGAIVIKQAILAKLMGLDPNDIPEPYLGLIKQEITHAAGYKKMQGGYRIIETAVLDTQNNLIIINDVSFNVGKQVVRYLRNSDMLAFFVCTAGQDITDRSKQFMAAGDYLEGYVADLTGSLLAEAAMDYLHNQLVDEMELKGLKVTNRYSPGYCNWDVAGQHNLFSLFPENFCEITLSDSALMSPIKSVSGVIGIGKNVRYNKYVCNACADVNCIYRNLNYM